ncbi:hypothetical protein [Nocardia sp. NPDC004722]
MSQNEVDQVTQETGRSIRHIIDLARNWLANRHQSARGQKMTRKERDDLARHLEAQVGAERIAATWFETRVGDYQNEARTVAAMRGMPDRYSPELVEAGEARLAAIRHRIESSLHGSGLALEHRGQVVQALDRVGHDPVTPAGRVFTPMTATEAMHARAAGVESELRTYAQQEAAYQQYLQQQAALQRPWYGQAAQQQAQRERAAAPASVPAVSAAATKEAAAAREFLQADAVQKIRHAENQWQRAQAEGNTGGNAQKAREQAARNAREVGLSPEQINWEFENAEANSQCRVRMDSTRIDGRAYVEFGYFATEAEAAEWTHKVITETNWEAGTQFTVSAREAGQRKPFYVAEGNRVSVGTDTGRWHDSARDVADHNFQQQNSENSSSTADSNSNGAAPSSQKRARPKRTRPMNAFAAAAASEQENGHENGFER